MRSLSLFFLALSLLAQTAPPQNVRVMSPLTTGLAHAIKGQEPQWHYIASGCSCPQLVPGQVSHDVGSWERRVGNQREFVYMDVYVVPSAAVAADWMAKFSRGEFGLVCKIERFELGEEAYLLTCPKRHHFFVNYRRGRTIVEVSGDARGDVERFAKHAFKLLPDS